MEDSESCPLRRKSTWSSPQIYLRDQQLQQGTQWDEGHWAETWGFVVVHFMCKGVWPAYISLCHMSHCCCRYQRIVSDSLELELQMVLGNDVGSMD